MKNNAVPDSLCLVVSACLISFAPDAFAAGTVYGWGSASPVPSGLTNVVAVAVGVNPSYVSGYSLALKADGTVAAWGRYDSLHLADVPAGLSNVVAISGGGSHRLAAKADGTVFAWNNATNILTNVFVGVGSVIALASGVSHDLALKNDGTVAYGQADVSLGLSNVIAIAAGDKHSLALKSDGTVVAWGDNYLGQCSVPPDLANAVAIAADGDHSVALRSDGSIVYWGYDEMTFRHLLPFKKTNIVAISSGTDQVLGLDYSGTLHSWGWPEISSSPSNVIVIASARNGCLAIAHDGSPVATRPCINQTAFTGNTVSFCVGAAGAAPLRHQWRQNGADILGETNFWLTLTNLQFADAGSYEVVVQNSYGILTNTNVILIVSNSAPRILQQTGGRSVAFGSNAVMSALVVGSEPMDYQWLLNGTLLPGATTSSISILGAQFANEGDYTLTISNTYGSVTSSNAFLNVVDIAEALGATNLTWSTGGDVPWIVSPFFTSVENESRPGSLNSFIETVISGPGVLTFGWQLLSSSFYAGTLSFSIDGVEQLSGTGYLYGQETFYFGAGTHTLRWTYNQSAEDDEGIGILHQVRFVAQPTPPFILVHPASQLKPERSIVTFNVSADGLAPLAYQWQFNGTDISNATNASLTLRNIQLIDQGDYSVVISNPQGSVTSTAAALTIVPSVVVTWGTQTNVPSALTNLLAVAAGYHYSLALRSDRTVAAWGNHYNSNYSYNNPTNVPAGLSNVIAISAGANHCLALKTDGTVVAWGDNSYGATNVPPGLSNVVSIVAASEDPYGGRRESMALKSDGTIVSWGTNYWGYGAPRGLSNVVAIATGVALKNDGTVVVWGYPTNMPAGLSNVIAIAAGYSHKLVLKEDGTVVGWGATVPPPGLSNVVAIASGGEYPSGYSMALKSDGTVLSWGYNSVFKTNAPPDLTNVVMIAAGANHSIALQADNPPVSSVHVVTPVVNSSGLTISIPSQSGKVFSLEYKNTLEDSNWTALPLVAGTGEYIDLTDPAATNGNRFYRVRRW